MTTARDFCNAINPDSPQNRKARAYLAARESIAEVIFDFDYVSPDERPTERTCHDLADDMLRVFPELVNRHISP